MVQCYMLQLDFYFYIALQTLNPALWKALKKSNPTEDRGIEPIHEGFVPKFRI